MTIAKDFVAKLTVAFVAVAMVFAAYAPAAQAQSSDDLQAMINDLLQQIAALESQVGQGASSVASGVCPFTWTRDLSQGSTGADVMKLQQFLNSDLDTRVAASGAGSVGSETEYYGPATAAAVSKMQVKYRSEVLSPAGLVNPTGYFGPSSRAKANSLCVSAPVVDGGDDDDMMDDEDEDEDDDRDTTLRGEASLDNFELDDGESTIEEGDEDVVVGEIAVEFTDGDAEISRLDITLSGATSDQPWDAFESFSLWIDGDKVAEVDASDEDEYLDEDEGELRFSGLDIFAGEDEELDILIGASVQDNLDAEELTDWTLEVSAMRFFDADGVATTESDPAGSDTAEFEIEVEGSDEELDISLASNNPDATDIVVDTDSDTDDVTILIADLEAEDNDLELNTVVVKVTVTAATSSNITSIIDEAKVMIGGDVFEAEAVGDESDYDAAADNDNDAGGLGSTGLSEGNSERASATTSVWYYFDIDGDVTLEEDESTPMEVMIDFNDTDDGNRYPNGSTIMAEITSVELAAWDAEGDDDLATDDFNGAATGDEHVLVAEGILVPADAVETDTDTVGEGSGQIGEFIINFDVTAVEGIFYIIDNATTTSVSPTSGVGYTLVSPDGAAAPTSLSATLSSDADEVGSTGVFRVNEGETETFTLTVSVDPATAGQYRVVLNDVFYTDNSDGTTGTVEYSTLPEQDFRTSFQSIVNS